jgi:hypothetical protein
MNTTELFVDQVLIGAVVLFVGIMVIDPQRVHDLSNPSLTFGAIFLGAAYLVGILYDRFADTLLEDLERHHRILFLLRGREPNTKKDPFPEEKYRARLLDKEGAAKHAAYLRTRMRLARAVATLCPAVGVAAMVPIFCSQGISVRLQLAAGLGILVAYAVAFVPKARARKKALKDVKDLKTTAEIRKFLGPVGLRLLALPSTKTLGGLEQSYMRLIDYDTRRKRPRSMVSFLWANEWLISIMFWTTITFAAIGVISARQCSDPATCLAAATLPVGGSVLALLFGWTWWRIMKTYRSFLLVYTDYLAESDIAKAQT